MLLENDIDVEHRICDVGSLNTALDGETLLSDDKRNCPSLNLYTHTQCGKGASARARAQMLERMRISHSPLLPDSTLILPSTKHRERMAQSTITLEVPAVSTGNRQPNVSVHLP